MMTYDPQTATFSDDGNPHDDPEPHIDEAPTLELVDRFEQVLGD